MTIQLPARTLDLRTETGPFDIIGDVHGCIDELIELLDQLGYCAELAGSGSERSAITRAPLRRRAVFVGDLVDRGPATPDVLRVVMAMVEAGQAWCVPGNHDNKFMRWLQGRPVKLTHGLDISTSQMRQEAESFHHRARAFIEALPHYLQLDHGRLVVAHAGIREDMIGRTSDSVRRFCLFGDTDNQHDAHGLPIRYHWAADYSGEPAIVYGHTPVAAPEWVNNTLCIDTGCVFGGALTALRWPEREVIAVPARDTYAMLRRPFGHPPPRSLQGV
jgi:protein phosphatase